jgi:drug/metabolite transporter (DMT)-like permease
VAAPSRTQVVAALGTLIFIWGTTWAAIRIGLEGIPPFTGVALRFGIASVVLLALAAALKVPLGRGRWEPALWVINCLFSFCISYGIVYWAEQYVPSGLTSVLFATFPLWTALLAHLLLPRERLTLRGGLGALVGFAGVAVIFSEDFSLLGGPGVAVAAAVMLLSPFISAVANVAIKRWGEGLHPLSLTAVPMGMTAVIMGGVAWYREGGESIHFTAASVGALLYLAILGSAVTFTLYYWLLSRLPATKLSFITYCVPLVAVAIGTLFLDEPLTPRVVAGSALVITGVVLAVRGGVRRASA